MPQQLQPGLRGSRLAITALLQQLLNSRLRWIKDVRGRRELPQRWVATAAGAGTCSTFTSSAGDNPRLLNTLTLSLGAASSSCCPLAQPLAGFQ